MTRGSGNTPGLKSSGLFPASHNFMALLTNPLLSMVTFLLGLLVGLALGRLLSKKEWTRREQLMKETFEVSRGMGCWVKAQIEANESDG
jgi:hypothetical protein